MIYFTSDTHFNHKNIVEGTSKWTDKTKTRPFKDLYLHNETLIHNINKVVKHDDTLYHLGDWSFGGIHSIWNFRKRLLCEDIHLILGNHDYHIERGKIYDIPGEDKSFNLRELFTSVSHYKEITVEKQHIILSHYAMRVWNKSHKGSWLLYGHSHGTINDNWGKSLIVTGKLK